MFRKTTAVNKAVLVLLLLSVSATAFAADHVVNLARRADGGLYKQKPNATVPPSVTEKYEYYAVEGNDEKELRRELCRHGCKWNDGKTYDSVTRWHVKWDYYYDQTAGSCSADGFRATVEITMRYPTWVWDEDASPSLIEKWAHYLQSLVTHEEGHRDMAVAAAADLTRTVAELPPAPTCADLDRTVNKLCKARLQRLDEEAKEYDAETLHGTAQGAAFP